MKLGRLNHIGVATPDLDASIAFYRDIMGATDITEPFVLESQKVRVCFVNTPGENGTEGTQVELLQPTETDSAVGKWLEKNPLGGQHHICYEVSDIIAARDQLLKSGARVLGDGEPKIGAHGNPVSLFFSFLTGTANANVVAMAEASVHNRLLASIFAEHGCTQNVVALVDGLVRRDLRRWGGGRESSFVYHYAKKAAIPLIIMAWVFYLALPFSLHPSWIILPFALVFGFAVTITASTFKKYL